MTRKHTVKLSFADLTVHCVTYLYIFLVRVCFDITIFESCSEKEKDIENERRKKKQIYLFAQ